ncbi:hypothetical protein GA707_18015 [Nostocoides sp. F2B08]|uniref:cell wall-binding repeat-containing protein n=1 Tax=Nostocoides sp. F2B08 TaxID=2653936 RepID=UPI001262E3EB|nr:cell wall-binding repeat-containing protein [Tetrasphaera sp. F2B08]KAB7741440.1 hypothetical protein GA707_18015 [Tetrasphaera sp. F2B08]
MMHERVDGRHRSRSMLAVVRVAVATVVTSVAMTLTPVMSAGSGPDRAPETTVLEEAVTPADAVVTADFDLAAVAVGPDSELAEVDVRVHADGEWSEWITLDVLSEDQGPDPGTEEHSASRTMTEPLLAAGSSRVEVRVPGGESAEVILVDGGPEERSPSAAASARPFIVTRAEWGANDSLMNCIPDSLPGYKGAVVHHTVNANTYTAAQAPALVRSIFAYHTTAQGWCDIGYQFLVDRFGTVYEGRTGALDRAVEGAQSAGFNTQTFGVSIIGDFSNEAPSAESLAAVDSVIQWQLALDGVDPRGESEFTSMGNGKFPAGTVVRLPTVMGHRDNGQTLCPGDRLYDLLPTFRTSLRSPLEPDPGVERQGGRDRYATSALISERAFPDGAPVAYLTSGLTFPDALSGAPAATASGGPLLITHPDYLPDVIAAELARLRPQRIIVLGGTGAVSDVVAEASAAYSTEGAARLGGSTRYATSALISAEMFAPDVPVAFVATGTAFPDALSGAPAAALLGGPLLLTLPDRVPDVIAAELGRLRPERIVVLGASGAVSDSVVETLGSLATLGAGRMSGPTRYETSARVSAGTFPSGVPVAYVATGRNFPDALSAAPVAGRQAGPLLITDPRSLSPAAAEELRRLAPQRIVVLGSDAAVSRRVHLALGEYLP